MYFLVIILNVLFALNPQIKEELPISIYINPEEYMSADSLLEFEKIGYKIEEPIEKSKYYFIVASLLNLIFFQLYYQFLHSTQLFFHLISLLL